jgi:hypothetical protein
VEGSLQTSSNEWVVVAAEKVIQVLPMSFYHIGHLILRAAIIQAL